MATYLKRTSKLFDLTVSRSTGNVNLGDLMCPVCRGILIEPVTLPCTHNLCLRCLKGTFEHNSLSCPLCRVRVGSWLRTATKTETLVNGSLWQLIRTRFPKEVEGRHNGDEGDIDLDPGFSSKKIILSAAGEIRREYEAQLQMAEEEMRRRRESERLANEALIRKIREDEERAALSQLASDRLLAKTLAKKQLTSECKSVASYCARRELENCPAASSSPESSGEVCAEKMARRRGEKSARKKSSGVAIASERSCQKTARDAALEPAPRRNRAARELRNDTDAGYAVEASCSGTQVYGTRSREELCVPTDVLSCKKKIIGVEICVTRNDNDSERIGSAESAGSHDSINQEIHHFKPIKPIARTSLKISQDGRPIDPKLIRVVPILVRVTNAVPKPPSPTHLKRILGCSWSAFRGKIRRSPEQHARRHGSPEVSEPAANEEPGSLCFSSSSLNSQRQQQQSNLRTLGKWPSKLQAPIAETSRRLELAPEVSLIDANKNYAKSINRIPNGATRVSKKLILDDKDEDRKVGKDTLQDSTELTIIGKATRSKTQTLLTLTSVKTPEAPDNPDETVDENADGRSAIAENIAERIKRRKCQEPKKTAASLSSPCQPEVRIATATTTATTTTGPTHATTSFASETRKARRRKTPRKSESLVTKSAPRTSEKINRTKKTAVPSKRPRVALGLKEHANRATAAENIRDDLDRRAIEEQSRLEMLIVQEKKDFELATRLQAHYDDMERIAARTRGGSRRAMENNSVVNNDSSVTTPSPFLDFEPSVDHRNDHDHPPRGHRHNPTRNRKQRGNPPKQAVK